MEPATGFVDLHTEWPLVRSTNKEVSRSSRDRGDDDDATVRRQDEAMSITYEAAIERYCEQSFLSGSQQRVCYSIAPFAAEVGKWLGMGVSPERVCRKLGKRNPVSAALSMFFIGSSSAAAVRLNNKGTQHSMKILNCYSLLAEYEGLKAIYCRLHAPGAAKTHVRECSSEKRTHHRKERNPITPQISAQRHPRARRKRVSMRGMRSDHRAWRRRHWIGEVDHRRFPRT
ncbi:expressed unknown protein [Ectocarpus siliculosus]|uniref:Uncharacterized protein n=1 Tax=Ectocarpus siliculosus TaxID=2880 RepID=D7FT41_ECTSI|nr:expressed unknown protein [Ectocarpus siliculosus]|eukprot:CBJ31332.1 expressed unknown protein [Ectocarpus siliculosus]